jgi:hypothetical protein
MTASFARLLGRPGRAVAVVLLLPAAACATTPRPTPIATSRLGIVKTPGTVARGVVQLEAGYSRGLQDGRTRQTFGETLLRVGMGPRTEARIGLSSYQWTKTPAATVEGRGDASLVIKHRLRDGAGVLPGVAVTLGSTVPTGVSRVGAGAFQPEGSLLAEWTLPAGFRALGMASHRHAVAAGDRFGQTTLAAAARRSLATAVVAQLDYAYGTSTRAGVADVHQLRAGAALRLTPSLQLDAWAGRATAAGVHEHLFGVGFARRW